MRALRRAGCALLCTVSFTVSTAAQEPYTVGSSVALSGYLAVIDGPWKDGVVLGAESVNRKGGLLGRKVNVVVQDMRAEPAEAVTVVRRMMTSQKVGALINGCSSAGNAAIAPRVSEAQIPMMLCSILPTRVEDQKWAFSLLPPPAFEIEPRFRYLQRVGLKKIALLFDPTPYAGAQKRSAEELAPKFGVEIVGSQQYKSTDADMTAYLIKFKSAGAQAVLKLGTGPSTITTAKAIKQLAMTTPLLGGTDDLSVMQSAAAVLNSRFIFVAQRVQVVDLLPKQEASTGAATEFLSLWKTRYRDRDPTWGSRGWDAFQVLAVAITKAGSLDGRKIRDAIENIAGHQGASGELTFSPKNHSGVAANPYTLAQIIESKIKIVQQ
jgi:branched-chain amino acid transport system substrate-binding protein